MSSDKIKFLNYSSVVFSPYWIRAASVSVRGVTEIDASDPFVVATNQQYEAEHIRSVIQKEPHVGNRMEFAHKINPTSYEVFRLILMIAIVFAPFTIISASCNLLQLAWLQACSPACRIQLL